MIKTKRNKGEMIYDRFSTLLESGYTKIQATTMIANRNNTLNNSKIHSNQKRCEAFHN